MIFAATPLLLLFQNFNIADPVIRNRLNGKFVFGGYMAWHGSPAADGVWARWNDEGHRVELNDISSMFWPRRNPYGSDCSIIRAQGNEMKAAGIDVAVALWNNVYPGEEQRIQKNS